MSGFSPRILSLALLGAGLAFPQQWQTANALPGVNLQGLTAAQKATVLKILRSQGCTCGCSMKLAQCRIEDPACSYSTGLAGTVVDAVKQGKSEADAIAAANGSRWAHPEGTGKVLDDPITIPVAGSPVTGAASAPMGRRTAREQDNWTAVSALCLLRRDRSPACLPVLVVA